MTAITTQMLSVVIVVDWRNYDTAGVYRSYRDAMSGTPIEFIYVLDGPNPTVEATLRALVAAGEPIRILGFPRPFGSVVCLREGVALARGQALALLTPHLQVAPESLGPMLEALDHADVVVAKRDRRADSVLNRARGGAFAAIARIAGSHFCDLGCHVAFLRREVFAELPLHDELHVFLGVFAERAGFNVAEALVAQADADRRARFHSPRLYFDQILDLVALAFLVRFLQKPFRFFGSLGALMALAGFALAAWLVVEKFVFGVGMNERPMLTLSVLLMVVGIQIAIAGLISEIIIFTRADNVATYRVAEVLEPRSAPGEAQLKVVYRNSSGRAADQP